MCVAEVGDVTAPLGSPLLRAAWFGLAPALFLTLLPGCGGIRVQRTQRATAFEGFRASAIRPNELSPRTLQTLRQWDLDHVYAQAPNEALQRLHKEAVRNPQPDLLFALAEINYVRGQQVEKASCCKAIPHYYLCAAYAYHYLFDEPPRPSPDMESSLKPMSIAPAPDAARLAGPGSPPAPRVDARSWVFDPRFRLACDLYNSGLAKCIAAAQRIGQLDPRHELRLPTPDDRGFTLSVVHHGFTWKPEEFGKLLFCADYQVVGLTNSHRSYGLGVPLIATRAATDADNVGHTFYPREASFAATAFFRFDGSLADLGTQHSGRLELYNPLTFQVVNVAGRSVPLETDLTTPLAYFLDQSKLDGLEELRGFLDADHIRGRTGIRMLAPYQPGKIPVVLVHGMLSSPLTWAPVINDLQADPILRERYQFWYYYYPTGATYLATAAELRKELALLRQELDPQHQDAALDQMVFAGHSMGGLVSKLMTVDSGNDFWQLVSEEPLDRLKLNDGIRGELQQMFFFQRQECVKCVIFLGTPHHGSKLSPSPLGRLADRLVHLPKSLMTASQDLMKENPDLTGVLTEQALATSVDLLAPSAPALELLAARPRPEKTHYHSIIGVISSPGVDLEVGRWIAGDSDEKGDGVVPYRSAHLENAESELVVPADHFHVHHHPLALLEVRRILLEHYQNVTRQMDAARGVQLLSAQTPAPAGR
jgi:pimeloyl-ACP methyl ester carboxylesterase